MHMTMDVPLSPIYQGSLNGEVQATDWRSKIKSRVDFKNLEKSGLKLVVAVISINPWWGTTEKQFDDQMNELAKFCELHPQWKIVKDPAEARRELAKGNKVLVLSLEGASFFKERELYAKLIEKYPIRIVTPIHFMDFTHSIGEPAKQKGLPTVIEWVAGKFFYNYESTPLTALGEELFHDLYRRRIWIDLSHASARVVDQFVKTRPQGYPLLMTHTVLKKYYGTDRGVDEEFLKLIAKEGGVVGLLPSVQMLEGTPTVANDCQKGNPYLVQWKELTEKVKLKNVYLGSDLNSPLPGIPPVNEVCSVLPYGLRTVADLKTLANLQDRQAITNFLNQWEKVIPKIIEPKRSRRLSQAR